jgi:hypothetical protein
MLFMLKLSSLRSFVGGARRSTAGITECSNWTVQITKLTNHLARMSMVLPLCSGWCWSAKEHRQKWFSPRQQVRSLCVCMCVYVKRSAHVKWTWWEHKSGRNRKCLVHTCPNTIYQILRLGWTNKTTLFYGLQWFNQPNHCTAALAELLYDLFKFWRYDDIEQRI